MTIYEIDSAIAALIDSETGEVTDIDAFTALDMARETKLEHIALAYKNAKAEAEAIMAERKTMQEREKSAGNKAERLKSLLDYACQGEKFQSPRVAVTYRSGTSVVLTDEGAFLAYALDGHDELLTYKEPEVNKTAVKNALGAGQAIPGVALETRQNIQIK